MSSIKISVRSPDTEWTVSLEQAEILIGRGGDAPLDIKIPDPSVSRCHGRIWVSTDGYWFEDNNSTHGSKKNESMVMGPIRIFSGDIIEVGSSLLVIEQADITEEDSGVTELFDVHLQDRLNLDQASQDKRRASGKIKVTGQKAYSAQESQKEKYNNAVFFGNLAKIFGFEDLEDALYLAIEDIVGKYEAAERGCILLFDAQENELAVRSHYPLFEPAVSTTLARKTIQEQQAFIWESDKSFLPSESQKKLNIKAGMYSPLTFGPRTLGVITVDTSSSLGEFSRIDLDLLINISQVLSGLIDAKQKRVG